MPQNPLLIIHGWSDHSHSFQPLANLLQQQLNKDIHLFDLADYLSMDDEITFDDIVTAMEHAWHKNQLPTQPYSVDVVVHSTGSLVIRDWLCRNFSPENCPIKHLVMLAPANFGSPLAHKGQAFIGRILKGFAGDKLFQVGEKILQGLELASPYSWELAQQDRFGIQDFYGPGKVLCTVLVGNSGYTGISAAANQPGTDGVVRIATANMNCTLLEADFSENPHQPSYYFRESKGITAFGIMADEDHTSITARNESPRNPLTIASIVGGLTVTDKDFITWCTQLAELTNNVMLDGQQNPYTHSYQNSVFLVENQFGEHIQDYFLEFYAPNAEQGWFAQTFHQDVITDVHICSQDKGYRSLYINYTMLHQQFNKSWEHMCLSLTALPEFSRNGNVGYRTFTDDDIGAIHFSRDQVAKLFAPNRTVLTRIIIRREQAERVFQLHNIG